MYVWICVLILFVTTYFTRMLPLILCKNQIKNPFLGSLLAYLPYAVLTAMIFPEVFETQMGVIPGIVGFFVAVFLAYKNKNLVTVLAVSIVATYIFMRLNPHIVSFF